MRIFAVDHVSPSRQSQFIEKECFAKQYSKGYLETVGIIRQQKPQLDIEGNHWFDLREDLPSLIMQEEDRWDDCIDLPLVSLTTFYQPKQTWLDRIVIPRVVMSLRRLHLLGITAYIQNLQSIDIRLRLLYACSFRDVTYAVNSLTVKRMIDFMPYLNRELLLQISLHIAPWKMRAVVEELARLGGYQNFMAWMVDSAPDRFFVSVYSKLSEPTCQTILPFVKRPDRFQKARALSVSLDNVSDAILTLMRREEELKLINTELSRTVEELGIKKLEVEKAMGQKEETLLQLSSLTKKIQKYVPAQLVEALLGEQGDTQIHKRAALTVFFSDIRNFTEITDRMEPEALALMLNRYLDEMTKIASKHGGTIDKFIGDAIVIFFGQPKSNGIQNDALSCVRMAIEMQEKMEELRTFWRKNGIEHPLHIRIGINSGFCTIGDFGSEFRKDYTIIGSEVNLAARLEQNARPDTIMISHQTRALIADQIETKPQGELEFKGFPRPIKTYEVHCEKMLDVQPISLKYQGFSLEVIPEKINRETHESISEALRKALILLDQQKM